MFSVIGLKSRDALAWIGTVRGPILSHFIIIIKNDPNSLKLIGFKTQLKRNVSAPYVATARARARRLHFDAQVTKSPPPPPPSSLQTFQKAVLDLKIIFFR